MVASDEQRVQAHEYGATTSDVCMQRDAPILHANILAGTCKSGPENKFKSSVSNRTRPFEEVICSPGYIVAVAIQLDVSKPKKIAEI